MLVMLRKFGLQMVSAKLMGSWSSAYECTNSNVVCILQLNYLNLSNLGFDSHCRLNYLPLVLKICIISTGWLLKKDGGGFLCAAKFENVPQSLLIDGILVLREIKCTVAGTIPCIFLSVVTTARRFFSDYHSSTLLFLKMITITESLKLPP